MFELPGSERPRSEPSGGFRAQQRFSDPMAPVPAEWSAPTPPRGLPIASPPPPASPADSGAPAAPPPDLSTDAVPGKDNPGPSAGWRKWLYRASGGLIDPGEKPDVLRRDTLVTQAQAPLRSCCRIAVLSQKGGVGKTTITASLGATFASVRDDRVIAVDANPDRGTLIQKVPLQSPATVRHLLRDAQGIESYRDVRRYTSKGPSQLEVLASEGDPAVSEAFGDEDYHHTLEVLERFYSLVLTDCGTGMLHSVMSAVIERADMLVVVSSGSADGARSASATLDWLDAHGHEALVRDAVVVVNGARAGTDQHRTKIDVDKVVDHFARRCRAVCQVPFDPHLEEGTEIDLQRLRRQTRQALLELAATVAQGFPEHRPPGEAPG